MCLKYISSKTLEAISFEGAVIALSGFLQKSPRADFQEDFYI